MRLAYFSFVFCVLCVSSFADVVNTKTSGGTNATKVQLEKLGPKNFLRLRAGGGKIAQPGTQKGGVNFVNAQKTVAETWLSEGIEDLKKATQINLGLIEGSFDILAPKIVGELSIFVVDDDKLPISVIAPEGRWAVVNVSPLKSDRPTYFKARVIKTMSRVFAMLCGGMASSFNLSLVGPVGSASDLDRFPNAQLPFDVLNRMSPYLKHFGVAPARVVTYRRACVEGWAPTPKDDIQRIIFDEVHSKPTEPIRIKFDPKKGE